MAMKESLRQFRRNSQYTSNISGSLRGIVSLRQQHEKEIANMFREGSSDEEEEGGWNRRVDSMLYSDTDSSSSDDDSGVSDESDEFAGIKDEINEKLRVRQRRFATLFKQGSTVVEEMKKEKERSLRHNPLIPQPMVEEDFRNRTRSRVRHENYFGDQAKSAFLNRYQWVAHEQSVLDSNEDAIHHTIFEENAKENSHSIDYPFMPCRPVGPDDVSVASKNPFEDDNISLLFCEDFDTQASEVVNQTSANSVANETYETHSVATLDLSATMQFNKETETSPRTKYIASCMQAKIHPRASLLLRRNVSAELNLQHQGMGDTMAKVLAKSLPDLPFVHSINLMDNNLTGEGLLPLIHGIAQLPSLTKINFSQNIVNRDTAIALASYVSETPILENLILHHADVDDYECTMFIAAITDNRALVELDLSHNMIGTSEILNNVNPDSTVGASSIADFLCSSNCNIRMLQLQWNKIRLHGAKSLANAMIMNNSLTHLDLAYNALGTEAGEILGHALLYNQTLTYLDVASNSINSSACFTICMGIVDNYCIKKVNLDNNPIGEFGLRMVMQMPLEVGNRVNISARSCNVSRKDPKDNIFRHDHPAGTYELKLEDPFHRAICLRLLRLVATDTNFRFKSFAYQRPIKENVFKGKKIFSSPKRYTRGKRNIQKKGREIRLVLSNSSDKLDHMDEATSALLHNLYKVEKASGNEELANQLFKEYDIDGNESLDVDEIQQLLKNIGIKFEREALVNAIALFDVDGAGTLEHAEFTQFLRAQKEDARSRIKELTENPIMASPKATTVKYIPPKVGTMFIDVEDSFSSNSTKVTMSSNTHDVMMKMIQGGTVSNAKALAFSIQHAKIHLIEAEKIFHSMSEDIKDPAAIIQKLLPRMANVREAKQLLLTSLTDLNGLNRLRKLMGSCLNPMIGLFNGFYHLDMSKNEDRVCMTKLLEQSQRRQDERINSSLLGKGLTGDISQKGDWSCFRNELKDGQPIQITNAMFNPMPTKGVFTFDFSGADPPPRKIQPISDERCLNVLINLELLAAAKKGAAENYLADLRRKCIDNNPGVGNFTPVINCRAQAEEIQFFMLRFYSKNSKRIKQIKLAVECEELRSTIIEKPAVLKNRIGKKGVKAGQLIESSSSDDEDDYYDEEAAINFVPVLGANSPLQKSRSQRQLVAQAKAGLGEIEEGSEDDDSVDSVQDEESVEKSVITTNSSEEEFLAEDVKSKALSMLALQRGNTNGGSRQTLLSHFDSAMQERHERKPKNDTQISKSEALEHMGMLANRRKRATLFNNLSDADKEAINRKQQEIEDELPELAKHPKAIAYKKLTAIIDVFQRVWLRSRHIAILLKYFSKGSIPRTADFGSYRVELVVLLFSRVVDVHNFDLVWEQLKNQEIACINCRLGVLNFFNPLKIEGCYSLDISRYEERVVAKILAILSTVEPGENWINESFRWEYFAECIPGWELTKSWLKEENMPRRGYLYLEYYSGGCTKFGVPLLKDGCNPNIIVRKSMLSLVYLHEDPIIDDECNVDSNGKKIHKRVLRTSKDGKKVKSQTVGAAYIKDYVDHFTNLLSPADSPSVQIAQGESVEKVFSKLKYSTLNIVRRLPKVTDVCFDLDDVIIDKSSVKGKKMLERLEALKAKRNEKESYDFEKLKEKSSHSKVPDATPRGGKAKSKTDAATPASDKTASSTRKKGKIDRMEKLRAESEAIRQKNVNRDTMLTVSPSERNAIVLKLKSSRGFIDRES